MMLIRAEQVPIAFMRQQAELELSSDRAGTTSRTHRSAYGLLLAHGQ
ncbi:hypothetical protein ACFVVA_12750 [Kitasatospora sp. NPDC058048]